jgi:hypothetical protein
MSWATLHIAALRRGETVQFRPRGHSMRGRIEDGQLLEVVPLREHEPPCVGDVVLCHVRGRDYLHLVRAVRGHGERTRWLIGNNRGGLNGWVAATAIFGRLAPR